MHEIECVITGRVQMVGFRVFAEHRAKMLGLVGYVENTNEGKVHMVAQGDRPRLQQFIEYMRNGPPVAQVDDVSVNWREPVNIFERFEIRI